MTRGLPTYLYDENAPRLLATPKHFAYVKIAEGCDHTCAFCAIPQMRGNYRSRRAGSIVREAEQLAAQGVKELVLISQDSTHYGEDLGVKDGLAELLRALARVDGIEWIRVMYSYPNSLSDATLAVMAEEQKVCSYLDMPLQHASAAVLKRMRRGGDRQLLEKLIERARRIVPGIAVRTTFIVGFPGETDEDFEELLPLCARSNSTASASSPIRTKRARTATNSDGKVPARVMRSRRAKLMRAAGGDFQAAQPGAVGRRFRALLEGVSEESELLLQARLESQAPEVDGHVLINDVPEGFAARPGRFHRDRDHRGARVRLSGGAEFGIEASAMAQNDRPSIEARQRLQGRQRHGRRGRRRGRHRASARASRRSRQGRSAPSSGC